jgi:hypothetical protein
MCADSNLEDPAGMVMRSQAAATPELALGRAEMLPKICK